MTLVHSMAALGESKPLTDNRARLPCYSPLRAIPWVPFAVILVESSKSP
jgi:hypothetical protein